LDCCLVLKDYFETSHSTNLGHPTYETVILPDTSDVYFNTKVAHGAILESLKILDLAKVGLDWAVNDIDNGSLAVNDIGNLIGYNLERLNKINSSYICENNRNTYIIYGDAINFFKETISTTLKHVGMLKHNLTTGRTHGELIEKFFETAEGIEYNPSVFQSVINLNDHLKVVENKLNLADKRLEKSLNYLGFKSTDGVVETIDYPGLEEGDLPRLFEETEGDTDDDFTGFEEGDLEKLFQYKDLDRLFNEAIPALGVKCDA